MNDPNHCSHPGHCPGGSTPDCDLSCTEACALHPGPDAAPIVLGEALERFRREAVRGTCDTGRYRMPYYTWGSGPPLLFIHGLGDSSHSFVQPIARLSAHFRCIAYDLPGGVGDNARLRRCTHANLVADVFALLDHLGLRQSYVLGSSLGTMIAVAALAAQPERLPRGILQGAMARRPLRRAERFLARLATFLPGPMSRVPLREKLLREVHSRLFACRSPDVWQCFLETTGQVRIATVGRQALLINSVDVRPLLPRVRQPVLLVYGDRDRVVPSVFSDVLYEGLPSAGRVVIEGCSHFPSYTHPEIFAEVIRSFLTPPAGEEKRNHG
jgi:pimeloyl-ACP methyl ester carboxylesterase